LSKGGVIHAKIKHILFSWLPQFDDD